MRRRRPSSIARGRRSGRIEFCETLRRTPLIPAENLRDVAAERLKDNGDTEAKVVEVLARAAAELKKS